MSGRPVDPTRSRIVLVGIPTYQDPRLPDVPEIANNIADLAELLTDPQLGGFDTAHCLVPPPDSGIAEVGDLLVQAAAEAEDLLMFYYSGHGLVGGRNHELYLSFAGTRPDRIGFTALPFAAVRDAFQESGAASRVVILDSCFSGRAIGNTLSASGEDVLGQVEVAGTYTLTSAPANRTAIVLPSERHTAFTGRLLRLLRDGSSQAGKMLSLGDIYRHLQTRLRAEGLPAPQQCGTETADLLGLVRNRFPSTSAGHTAANYDEPSIRTPRGVGILVEDEKTGVKRSLTLIPANARIPTEARITYHIADDNKSIIEIVVVEIELGIDEVDLLGKMSYSLFLQHSYPKGYPIEITFKLNIYGILSIEAHDGQSKDFLGLARRSANYGGDLLGYRLAAPPRQEPRE